MSEVLFWLYLANAVLLIDHEIDSAYWREWDLFGLPGGIAGFLAMHVPLLGLVLYGLVAVREGGTAGLVFSLALALSGVGAFLVHGWFLRRGRPEFDTPASRWLLRAILTVSLAQGAVSILLITGR